MTKRRPTDEVILDIPFHHQQHDFTCGAACLMMAMKYFDPSLKMSEDLEIDVWRESNLVEDWSTCGRGLAYSAAKRGYGAKIFASVDDIPFKDKILSVCPMADTKVLDFFFRDMKRRALAMGVP
ncbi:MAG: peptidase C39 family protein, partial [Candidatus Bathyarchaeota archaeon]